jgi:peroxiredoxin
MIQKAKWFSALLTIACSLHAQEKYFINGNLDAYRNTAVSIWLVDMDKKVIDSTILKAGRFFFKGSIVEPKPVWVMVGDREKPQDRKSSKDWMLFYLEAGDISIFGNDSIKKAIVEGGEENKNYKSFNTQRRLLIDRYNQMRLSANKKGDDNRYKALSITDDSLYLMYTDFIKTHTTSFVSLYALSKIEKDLLNGLNRADSIFQKCISKNVKNSHEGTIYYQGLDLRKREKSVDLLLKSQNDQGDLLGNDAPGFTAMDSYSNMVSLKEIVTKNKFTLLVFWGSSPEWRFARKELNDLKEVYSKFRDIGFTIVALSLDRNINDWKKAVNEDELPFTHLIDTMALNSMASKQYYIVATLPFNFLIDPENKIIAVNYPKENLEIKLDEVIKDKK